MLKSEYARQQVLAWLRGADEVVYISDLIHVAWRLTDDGDPRWIGVALMHLVKEGLVRYPTCDDNHNHDSTCTVKLVAPSA